MSAAKILTTNELVSLLEYLDTKPGLLRNIYEDATKTWRDSRVTLGLISWSHIEHFNEFVYSLFLCSLKFEFYYLFFIYYFYVIFCSCVIIVIHEL